MPTDQSKPRHHWRRSLLASIAALSLSGHDAAWALCADGSAYPTNGFVVGSAQLPAASNWTPGTFTSTNGSFFVPDSSVNEHNDPTQPLTQGGHNWVLDQGATLCKQTDIGPAGGVATSWAIPQNSGSDCVLLAIFKGSVLVGFGDGVSRAEALTPTCDPTLLSTATAPNPANTYANQLGCSIYHGVKTDAPHATTFLFVVGPKGSLIMVELTPVTNPTSGGEAGKIVGGQSPYSTIPDGQQLTNVAVNNDGQFVIASSNKKQQSIFACLNPLGDPGDPSRPINPAFAITPTTTVACMQVGNNALAVDQATTFGADSQPYFGGQRSAGTVVNSFDATPGGTAKTAWPNCIWQNNGSTSLADAFAHKRTNGCGNAASNTSVSAFLATAPTAFARHGAYLYAGLSGGSVVQFKVTTDPATGLSKYAARPYLSGVSSVTGVGVADDLGSLMVYSDPSQIGLAGQEVVTKLPVCEDIP
jgi:hypothetical protein